MESKQTVLGIAALFARIRWQSHNDAAARDYARLKSVFKCMTFFCSFIAIISDKRIVSAADGL